MQLGEAFITLTLNLPSTALRTLEADATKVGQTAGKALSTAMAKEVADGTKKLGATSSGAQGLVKGFEAIGKKAGTALGAELSKAAASAVDLKKVTPDAKLSTAFGQAGTKAGTSLGTELSTAAFKHTDLRKITPDSRIATTFGAAGTKAGSALGTNLTEGAKRATNLKGIAPDASIAKNFGEAGTRAGKALGGNIGPAAKSSSGSGISWIKVPEYTAAFGQAGTKAGNALGNNLTEAVRKTSDVKNIKPPEKLDELFGNAGTKAGKALGDNIGKAAKTSSNVTGIKPPDNLNTTFGKAGTDAGQSLGKNLAEAARKSSNVTGIKPPPAISKEFGDAGTTAGKNFGTNLSNGARRSLNLSGVAPPESIATTFGKAGTHAGTVFGEDLSKSAKANLNLKGIAPPDTIAKQFSESGRKAGGGFAEAFRTSISAAVKNLPDAKLTVNSTEADKKVQALRAELKTLGDKKIGVDIDAATARGKIYKLGEDLKNLSTDTKDIRVSVDTGLAAAELKKLSAEMSKLDNRKITTNVGIKDTGVVASLNRIGGEGGAAFAKQIDEKTKGAAESMKRNLVEGAKMLGPIAFVGAISAIAKVGSEYENNMNMFKAVTKATNVEMALAAKTAVALGNDVKLPGVSAADAAEAMTELSKSGLNVRDAMGAAKATLQLSRVAELGAGAAANIAAGAMNTFGLKAEDLTGVIDEFANVANSSAVDVKDVADSFKMASAVFAGFQGPSIGAKAALDELNISIGILGQNGIVGSDAGTSLKQAILNLTAPAMKTQREMDSLYNTMVTGNEGMKLYIKSMDGSGKAADMAGQKLMDMAHGVGQTGSFAYDATGKMRPLHQIVELLAQATKTLTIEEKNRIVTQIFGADSSRAIITLMKGGLPAYNAMSEAIHRQGSAAELSAAKNAGLSGAFDTLKGAVETAAISIYTALSKPITGGLFVAADKLPKMLSVLGGEASKLIGPLGQVVTFIGNVIRAFGPLGAALGVTAWIALRTAIQAIGLVLTPLNAIMSAHTTTSKILGTAIGLLVIAFNAEKIAAIAGGVAVKAASLIMSASAIATRVAYIAVNAWTIAVNIANVASKAWAAGVLLLNAAWLANPIGVVVIAVTALIAILVLAYKNNETFRNIVNSVWAAIKTAIGATVTWFTNTAWPALKVAFDAFVATMKALVTFVTPAWTAIKVPILAFSSWFSGTFVPLVKVGATALGTVFTWLWHNIIEPVWNGIKLAVAAAWTAIQATFNAGKVAIQAIGTAFTWVWHSVIEPAWGGIKLAIATAWVAIQATFNAGKVAIQALGTVFTWLWHNIIEPVWTGIRIAVQIAWVAIQIVYKTWEIAGKVLALAVQWFWTAVIKPTWTAISTFLVSTWNSIKTTVFDAWGTYIKGPFTAMWNAFKAFFTTLWATIKTMLVTAWTAIKTTVFDVWANYIKGPFTAMWNAFKVWFTTLWTSIKTMLVTAWTAIKTTVFDVWANYIKGPFTAMWNAFKAWFTALWAAIKTMLVAAWAAIKTTVFDVWANYIKGPFTAMWNAFKGFLTGLWAAIKAMLSAAWGAIKSGVLDPMVAFVKGPVVSAYNSMKTSVVNAWNNMKSALGAGWSWLKSNVFNPVAAMITKTIPNAFSSGVSAIGKAWTKIQDVVKAPIKFVVNTVLNNGIIKGFNAIASKVGVSTIAPISLGFADGGVVPAMNAAQGGRGQSRGFATGGVMPGYTPGRDVHSFVSPTGGKLNLSGGEAVMRPEWTKAVGGRFVDTMNQAARSGGVGGVKSAMGMARGGVIPTQSLKDGGVVDTVSSWWEDISGMVKSAAQTIGDMTGIANSVPASPWMRGMLKNMVSMLMTGAKNTVMGAHTGGGTAGQTNVIGSTSTGQGYRWQIAALQKLGLGARITSTTGGGHATNSWHYKGRAIDIGNESMAMFNAIKKNFGAKSLELIYGPAGGGNIWHGKPHNYSASTLAAHYNHIHWAYDKGGMVPGGKGIPASYDNGGWLSPGQSGINLGRKPEAVLTPEESKGLKGLGVGELIDKLDELIDAVEKVAPGVGNAMRGTGTSLRVAGRGV